MLSPLFTGSVVYSDVPIPLAYDGELVCGVIADFHFSTLRRNPPLYDKEICCLDEGTLETAVEHVNRQNPDFVFLLGDFVNHDPRCMDILMTHLSQLTSKHGIYACLGNHDHLVPGGKECIRKSLEDAGIRVLWNEAVSVLDGRLAIAGLADTFSGETDVSILGKIPKHIPRIVLAHSPDVMHYAKDHRVDVMLAGHTHGGQLALPGGVPLTSVVRSAIDWLPVSARGVVPRFLTNKAYAVQHWDWCAGLYRVTEDDFRRVEASDNCDCLWRSSHSYESSFPKREVEPQGVSELTWTEDNGSTAEPRTRFLYVTRGLGTHPPARTLCPPEVTTVRFGRELGVAARSEAVVRSADRKINQKETFIDDEPRAKETRIPSRARPNDATAGSAVRRSVRRSKMD